MKIETINKKIRELEKEREKIKKIQQEEMFKKSMIDLEDKITFAIMMNLKIKSIYVSTGIFRAMENYHLNMSSFGFVPPNFEPPIKYKGYTVYCNHQLKEGTIEVAI